MSVIYIRDEDGKFIPLPTVKGADNTNVAVKGEEYIYFKKNCPDWSEPRIYFFNNHVTGWEEHAGSEYDTAYSWDRSPYMLYDEATGYYYYPISRGYDSVIFFCDNRSEDGWNYKTNICHIPSSTWYSAPLFVQSKIGYDGFWADYNTKMAKLLIQHNPHMSSLDPIDDTKITDAFCIVGDSTKELSIKDFGMNVVLGDGEVPNQRSHYEYIEFPIDAKSISFTFNEYDPNDQDKNNRNILFSRQVELNLYEVCYIYPVIYLQGVLFTYDYNIQGTVSGFNAASDSVLFPKLFSNRDHNLIEKDLDFLKGNLDKIYNNIQNGIGSIETRITYYSYGNINISGEDSDGDTWGIVDCIWRRYGNVVQLEGNITIGGADENISLLFGNCLPFVCRTAVDKTIYETSDYKVKLKTYNNASDLSFSWSPRSYFVDNSSRIERSFSLEYITDF